MKPGSRTEKKHGTSEFNRSRKKKQKYKKHMGSKFEGQGFADRRKNRAVHAYNKLLQKEKHDLSIWTEKVQQIYNEDSGVSVTNPVCNEDGGVSVTSPVCNEDSGVSVTSPEVSSTRKRKKVSSFHNAEGEWKKTQEEKKTKYQEVLERKKSQEAALENYRRKKTQRHKKLSKRNYKGQPNMAGQMELLLQKIQSQ